MKYTTQIIKVQVNNSSEKLIVQAYWRMNFTDDQDQYIGSDTGMVDLEPDQDPVPFDEIGQEQLASWVNSRLDIDTIYEGCLARKLQEQQQNTTLLEPPWKGGGAYNQPRR